MNPSAAIPRLIHFIYVGGRPFSFINFLAVYTAWRVNRPERLYLHHTEEPQGPWWDKAKPFLTLNRVDPVHEIYGNPVRYPAHQADVIRMDVLLRFGGIYLDLDVICINPFEPLLQHECVMGMEPGTGLCNAVILARPGSAFLGRWQSHYRDFDGGLWNHHSVVLPWQLAKARPDDIHIESKYAFFYPAHNDPVHRYLWGQRPALTEIATRLAKNAIQCVAQALPGRGDEVKQAYYRTFHALRGPKWHFRKLTSAYAVHLWEGLWGKPYLEAIDPDYLLSDGSHFARLIRTLLSQEELVAMGLPGPMQRPDQASA